MQERAYGLGQQTGYAIPPQPPSGASQAPIPEACDHLGRCISGLAESLHALESRLVPVLAPEQPVSEAKGAGVAQIAPSPLCASISSAAYSVASLQSRIDYLLSRLHL